MAKPGFWNDNSQRDYPFLLNRIGRRDLDGGPIGEIPYQTIVDVGFIFGPSSGFSSGVNSVWLAKITRLALDRFEFEFATDAESLSTSRLVFRHEISEDYTYSTAESSESFEDCGDIPAWEGYLVTGDLSGLAVLLPDTDDFILGISTQAVVEPCVVQNFHGHFATGISVANLDRTRATNPDGCRELCWPADQENVRIRERCLTGTVAFREGYNIVIQEDVGRNRLIFSAVVGQGEGEPCEPVKYYEDERPPRGRDLLDGSVSCGETVRSLGGATGPAVEIVAGGGASVSFDPEESRVVVDLNLRDLVLSGAFDPNEPCEGSMTFVDPDECSCGPA